MAVERTFTLKPGEIVILDLDGKTYYRGEALDVSTRADFQLGVAFGMSGRLTKTNSSGNVAAIGQSAEIMGLTAEQAQRLMREIDATAEAA